MKPWAATAILCAAASLWAGGRPARGDGGTIRVSRRAGPYQVSVFTLPTPLRVGRADLSVLVQDPESGAVVGDAAVAIRLTPPGARRPARSYRATHAQATNKLLVAALVEFQPAGSWTVAVDVEGTAGSGHLEFAADVLPGPPPWLTLLPWVAWPLLPIGLFALREILVHRSRRGPGSRGRP